ncbi:hypothetical protein, partial [Pseudomonas aeruginosa]|uniref:hypothetical protein n=1 Tax=Pseudomonas aeruginosa TaxID=287 RepID=UPI0021F19ED6
MTSWKRGAAPGPLRRITSQAFSADGLQKRGGGGGGGGGAAPGGGGGGGARGGGARTGRRR